MDKKERDAVERDRILFGTGIAVDGKRIDPATVTISPAAPAPSSLAGGAVTPEFIEPFVRQWCVSNGIDPDEPTPPHGEWPRWYDEAGPFAAMAKSILAALSPEAPARKGDESFDNVEARAEAWSDRAEIQRMVEATTGVFAKWSSPEILSRFRQQFMAVVQQAYIEGYDAAITPRHEAPADPCASHRSMGIHIDPCCPHCEAPAEGAGEREEIARTLWISRGGLDRLFDEGAEWKNGNGFEQRQQCFIDADAILALRARSSAPEAREVKS